MFAATFKAYIPLAAESKSFNSEACSTIPAVIASVQRSVLCILAEVIESEVESELFPNRFPLVGETLSAEFTGEFTFLEDAVDRD